MDQLETDIAIVGAGMAGAALAAAVGTRARCLMLEAEALPGQHATGRSAAFWAESYGGPGVQPLTTASGPWLAANRFLHPRGCLHVATAPEQLAPLATALGGAGIAWATLDGAALRRRVPHLHPRFAYGIWEPSCQDIDVGALHAARLAAARAAGAVLRCRAPLQAATRQQEGWQLQVPGASIRARVLANAAGAWAGQVAALAGAAQITIQPMRRTVVQLAVSPAPAADQPLVMDAMGGFYFKPEAGGRLWLSPHDETPVVAHDVAAEELDQALAIDRFERATNWRVLRRERAWAGLRSFAPDRLPVYGYDEQVPGFFWCAGQGGFGIQTAPAASALAAALLLGCPPPASLAAIDFSRYRPGRFAAAQRAG